MVGDHFPDKIFIELVFVRCTRHFCEHALGNLVDPALVQAEVLAAVFAHPAGTLDFLHVFNAFCLLCNDAARNVL